MSARVLVLFGGAAPDGPMSWLLVERASRSVLTRGVLQAGETAPAAPEAVLILPGAEAQARRIEVSASTEAQALAASRLLFRDSLAAGSGEIACTVGRAGDGGARLAVAMNAGRLEQWRQRCRAARTQLSAVHLDCLLWPAPQGAVQVIEIDGRCVVAGGSAGGFAIESDLAARLLPAWLAQAQGIGRVQIAGQPSDAVRAAVQGAGRALEVIAQPDDPLAILAREAADPRSAAPNLLQEGFSTSPGGALSLKAWLPAIALAAVLVALQVVVLVMDGRRDEAHARALSDLAEKQFLDLQPGVHRIVNLRAQLSGALNSAAAQPPHPAVALTQPLSTWLIAHPGVRLDDVRYEGPGRSVEIRLSATTGAELDAVSASLSQVAANPRLGQMRVQDGRATLTATLEAP